MHSIASSLVSVLLLRTTGNGAYPLEVPIAGFESCPCPFLTIEVETMTIKTTFNPDKLTAADGKIKDIFNNETARKLWCLWKRGHIVSQHFDDAVLEIAQRIDELPFVTVQGLINSFQVYRYHDFTDSDVANFVGDYVFYFSNPLEYPLTIEVR